MSAEMAKSGAVANIQFSMRQPNKVVAIRKTGSPGSAFFLKIISKTTKEEMLQQAAVRLFLVAGVRCHSETIHRITTKAVFA